MVVVWSSLVPDLLHVVDDLRETHHALQVILVEGQIRCYQPVIQHLIHVHVTNSSRSLHVVNEPVLRSAVVGHSQLDELHT